MDYNMCVMAYSGRQALFCHLNLIIFKFKADLPFQWSVVDVVVSKIF